MRPMLASGDVHVPQGPQWSHEVKWDGMRILADVSAATVCLTSRNERDVSVSWPDVARLPDGVDDLLVDGEVIALDARGVPDFRTLQDRIHVRSPASAARWAEELPATFMVFDVLRVQGRWLLDLPLAERRVVLAGLDLASVGWQVPAAFGDGEALHRATREQGLEGIVSKRLDSRYEPGARSRSWRKFAHRMRGSYVVGGWRPQVGTTHRLASLLVGEMTPQGLRYRGRVGSGIGTKASVMLSDLLAGTERSESPFVDQVPSQDAAGTRWLDPVLVVEVESLGSTGERLRQPSFQGVRSDVSAADLAQGER